MDVKGAADSGGQGRTLRQIGAQPGVSRTTVSEQLRGAGVTMRRGGPPATHLIDRAKAGDTRKAALRVARARREGQPC